MSISHEELKQYYKQLVNKLQQVSRDCIEYSDYKNTEFEKDTKSERHIIAAYNKGVSTAYRTHAEKLQLIIKIYGEFVD